MRVGATSVSREAGTEPTTGNTSCRSVESESPVSATASDPAGSQYDLGEVEGEGNPVTMIPGSWTQYTTCDFILDVLFTACGVIRIPVCMSQDLSCRNRAMKMLKSTISRPKPKRNLGHTPRCLVFIIPKERSCGMFTLSFVNSVINRIT